MKRILTYGTYDLLHYGHINLLKRAKSLGDYLIVAISTDEFNKNMKNKVCIQTYEERKTILESLRFVILSSQKKTGSKKLKMLSYIRLIHFVWGATGKENSIF